MLLKYIDETIIRGNYDLKVKDNVTAYLAEPSLGEKLMEWKGVAGKEEIPRKLLHYDDTLDSSKELIKSWQRFCNSGALLGEGKLYRGGSCFFTAGHSNFGGVAKAAVYLRYSEGFLQWLATFDPKVAERLRVEKTDVEKNKDINLFSESSGLKLSGKWHNFNNKDYKGDWALPVVTSLTNGKRLVLWLSASADKEDWSVFDTWNVDIPHSLELMKFLTDPSGGTISANAQKDTLFEEDCEDSLKGERQKSIADEFQMGSGMGRNCFGKEFKATDRIPDCEYVRLKGTLSDSERSSILELWGNRLKYKVKVAPSPDTSCLIFLPEGDLKYSELKRFVDEENARLMLFWEMKKQKKTASDGVKDDMTITPNVIPSYECATLFLIHEEGSQKKKVIIQQIFPSVELDYLQNLNAFLMRSSLQYLVVNYMKKALTHQESDTPSVYRYWTSLFTHALQKQYINASEAYAQFQRYVKGFKGEDITQFSVGSPYFNLIENLKALQKLIHNARKTNDPQPPGVFEGMENTKSPQELVGEVFGLLREKQQNKLSRFVEQARGAVPPPDFARFIRGALVGMLLNELPYILEKEGRRFTTTQGRHPSRLRGEELIQMFTKGIGLLENLNKTFLFNCQTLPFIKSCQEESRKDAFNSGLIMGMVYFEPKNNKLEEKNND